VVYNYLHVTHCIFCEISTFPMIPIEKVLLCEGNMYVNRKRCSAQCAESHSVRVGGALFVVCAALSMLLNRRLGVPPLRAECWKVWEQTQNASTQKVIHHDKAAVSQVSTHAALLTLARRPCCWIKLFQLSRHLALARVNSARVYLWNKYTHTLEHCDWASGVNREISKRVIDEIFPTPPREAEIRVGDSDIRFIARRSRCGLD
jgi:hypothetical protein